MKNRMLSIVLLLFTAFGVSGQVPSYVPTNGLVGYWPFNGNANDESGNGNNGTVNGATLAADRFGVSDRAYSFDGQDDYISGTSSGSLNVVNTQQLSMSCWINFENLPPLLPNNTGSSARIFSFSDQVGTITNQQYGIMGTNDGGIYWLAHGPAGFESNGTNVTNQPLYSTGTWEYLAMTYDGETIKLYHNASLVLTKQEIDYFVSGPTGFFTISSTTLNPVKTFDGRIDDIGIWNRALTADEVLALYNGCNVTPQVVTGNTTPSAFANSTYTCNNTAGSTYSWSVNNGVIVSGQGTNSITVLWGAEGVGSVTVAETTADGCVGDEVIYDVNVQCVVSGTSITGPVGPEAFSNSTYTCNGAANSTYNWTVNNGVISSGQGTNTVNILWASTGLGNVSVVETTAEGCVGTTLSQDVVVIPTNVEELANQLILYPNPVTTSLTLQVKSEMIGSDFVVFDALCKVVLRDKILSSNQNISVINLSNGNYILRVGAMNKAFTISK